MFPQVFFKLIQLSLANFFQFDPIIAKMSVRINFVPIQFLNLKFQCLKGISKFKNQAQL